MGVIRRVASMSSEKTSENVLRVVDVGHPFADEVPQPIALAWRSVICQHAVGGHVQHSRGCLHLFL
jgi:hypothetical protein